jgi:hypothetical protein
MTTEGVTHEPQLPPRSGERPRTNPTNPHQQVDQTAPAEIQEELWRRMASLEGVSAGRSGVSLPESRAVHLDPGLARGPREAYLVGTEFAHLHGAADGSLHVTLPTAVAAEAIDSGWESSTRWRAEGLLRLPS